MFDFLDVKVDLKKNIYEISPNLLTTSSNDLMTRGGVFYAFWDEDTCLWSTDVRKLFLKIDELLFKKADELKKEKPVHVNTVKHYDSGFVSKFNRYCKDIPDNYVDLDSFVLFENDDVKKTHYASFKLSYSMCNGDTSAYDKLMSTLYEPSEREKIEWAIGSVIAGDSRKIQKLYVLYGDKGSGKSTVLNIIEMIFKGYTRYFRSQTLGDKNNQFALETLKDNPLIAIDHDADMSNIKDNTLFNTVVSHESTIVNVKFEHPRTVDFKTTLFVGSNSPVRITDNKSGLLRRLIDIHPSGRRIPFDEYKKLMDQIAFELGAIAKHCFDVYEKCGDSYYADYIPTSMFDETNDMYNFVSEMYLDWVGDEYISLASAWDEYKKWCKDAGVPYPYTKRKFKNELKGYFENFEERAHATTNVYSKLRFDKFNKGVKLSEKKKATWIEFNNETSLLDDILSDCKAQLATDEGIPRAKWENVRTKLKDIDTSKMHYVRMPKNYIVIDFDIKDKEGYKSLELNLKAAKAFPPTYAELSKSGSGIHLHYIYEGDVEALSRMYTDEIEVKVFTGKSSLRRCLTKCNDIPLLTINSGLPLKPKKGESMIDAKSVENESHLRALIKKSLNKEVHGHTKPEVDFMNKILNDAYANESLSYDIRDMRPFILSFAMTSTHQSQKAYEMASAMKYCSKDHEEGVKGDIAGSADWNESPIVIFDVEVFKNLLIVCWKHAGENKKVVRLINPPPNMIKDLFKLRLVGFNNRRYDNHILYARAQGYTNEELYNLSQKIITRKNNCYFGEAYGISYTDIYDYCSNANKMSLKKWEIKLGLYHLENQYPWDEPLDESHWKEVTEYCVNDVLATEAVWNATQADFRGRQILAELSGLTVNDTSNTHTQQIIFGNDRNPQSEFNYPDLSKEFPGYEFKNGKSTYMGEKVGEGGWVFAKPGMYVNAKCEDVSGMHPASIYAMKLFGDEYTERYYDLVRARTFIKHKDYESVRKMFDGRLAKYLGSDDEAKELSNALKTPINSVYGLTAAHFPNRCRDPRNVDNVVAKRGALFMITLKNEVEKKGYTVIHCKTDSIKIADPDDDILKFIEDFGKKYGYTFEIEDEFERICLVNGSTFVGIDGEGNWRVKAAQFAHPYVFKSLFSHDDIEFKDLCEAREVKVGSMYLDRNHDLPDVTEKEKELKKVLKKTPDDISTINDLKEEIAKGHDYHYVGKVGLFTPVSHGGGVLYCSEDGVKFNAITGTKGYRFIESDKLRQDQVEDRVDLSYFDKLVDEAYANISKYGDADIFINANHDVYEAYIHNLDAETESLPF